MKKFRKAIAALLMLVMCMVLLSFTAIAVNTDGVEYAATLDKSTIDTSASAQQIVMTVKANKKFLVDAMGMTVLVPEGWILASIENAELNFGASNVNLGAGTVNYATADAENWTTDLVVKVTYNVPANVAAGTYTLGIKDLVISKDYGTRWEKNGTASVTLTVNGTAHTCQHDHYNITETTHQSVCACGKTIGEAVAHTGGKATCMSGATCEACGQNYGELDPKNHAGDIIQKEQVTKEPSCGEPGKKIVTDFCSKCMTPVSEKEVEIPAAGKHVDADGVWESDGINHFHTCSCGTKFDEGKHTGGKATCMSGATCESCGLNYGELDPKNHAGDTIQKELVTKEPSCGEPGKKTVTDFCDKCMTPINEKEVEIPATGEHKGGKATCMKKAVCEVCGKEYGEKDRENHSWNEKWYQDEKVHWHECDICHEGRDMKEHYDNDGDKKCDDCDYPMHSIPSTGAPSIIGLVVAVMAVSACGVVLFFKKRKTAC